jgi:hypothetical protein
MCFGDGGSLGVVGRMGNTLRHDFRPHKSGGHQASRHESRLLSIFPHSVTGHFRVLRLSSVQLRLAVRLSQLHGCVIFSYYAHSFRLLGTNRALHGARPITLTT